MINGFITEMKDKNGDSWYHQIVLEMKDDEIKRLKEEYMILQNASDEVEEEKDREIERLNKQLQLISDEFLKYDWETSSKEQTINQLKNLYYSIFKGSDKE